jgi:hypothetical protein
VTAARNPSEGTDRVETGLGWILADNLENLTLVGTATIDGTGNALTGNGVANPRTFFEPALSRSHGGTKKGNSKTKTCV